MEKCHWFRSVGVVKTVDDLGESNAEGWMNLHVVSFMFENKIKHFYLNVTCKHESVIFMNQAYANCK